MNTAEQEQALAQIAAGEDLQARAELIQAQAKRMEDGLAQAEAQNRFDALRQQYPHATPEQICSMLEREPGQHVSAVQRVNAIQS